MNPGEYRHRITFESPQQTQNENGGYVNDYSPFKSVWAKIVTNKGRQYYQAAATQNESTIIFSIRYTTGLNADMRITYKNRKFDITSITNDDERNRTMTIIAKEVV